MPAVDSPALMYDIKRLDRNFFLLKEISERAGVTILYALKASYAVLPFLQNRGVVGEVSSLFEARYAVEMLGQKVHAFLVSLTEEEWKGGIADLCSHISFNSLSQGADFAEEAVAKGIICGLRVNPEVQSAAHSDYDPCEPGGRFGCSIFELPKTLPEWLSGFHVHALCENGATEFSALLDAFEERASHYLPHLSWVNFGGGHLLTADSYDREFFIRRISAFKEKYPHLKIYCEPGAAWVWDAATLKTTVTDVVVNRGVSTLILDISFRAHFSDFLVGKAISTLHLESTSLKHVSPQEAAKISPKEKKQLYRLGGASCAACDYKEFYFSEREIRVGDTLVFNNMGHYCDVTFSMFNGIRPPSIYYVKEDGEVNLVKSFSFGDFCSLVPPTK